MSTVEHKRGKPAGTFSGQPAGIILHGSRGGAADLMTEYRGTANWAVANPDGLCWNATIGPDIYAVHLTAHEWGWNARQHSRDYLAVEFAQATVKDPILDAQVQSFVDWYYAYVHGEWPNLLPLLMGEGLPAHSELPAGINDGKSDVFPRRDGRLFELRQRIRAALKGSAVDPNDAALERLWQLERTRLGEKRYSATYAREWAGSKVLVCQRGVLAADDGTAFDITQRVLEDWETIFGPPPAGNGDLVRLGD